jgi:hypothetical protein
LTCRNVNVQHAKPREKTRCDLRVEGLALASGQVLDMVLDPLLDRHAAAVGCPRSRRQVVGLQRLGRPDQVDEVSESLAVFGGLEGQRPLASIMPKQHFSKRRTVFAGTRPHARHGLSHYAQGVGFSLDK